MRGRNRDEANFARHGATLRRHFPEAYTYVFHDLKAQSGTPAVMGVATFLLRIDALEQGSDPTRAATRAQDAEAVKLLEKRGLSKAEREQLRKLVDIALGPTQPLAALPRTDESGAARLVRLAALREWYNEWSSIARAVVKKRAYLIRLGLAVRKVGAAEDAGEEEVAPSA
jgi:hypothetical protein